jgi:hypothetical protein
MHKDPLALAAFQGPRASEGILLFVIVLTALLILMIYAVVRAPAWQPTRPADGAGPRPGDRPAPLPRRARHTAHSVFQPLPGGQTARPAAAAAAAASAVAAVPHPIPHPADARVPAGAPAARGLTPSPAEPDPMVLERPVVTGRPPWGPAPRPPGLI